MNLPRPAEYAFLIALLSLTACGLARGADVSAVYGDFILQPLYNSDSDRTPPRGGRLVDENELRLPGVDGLTIRIIPGDLSKNGKWNPTFVDQCVARCRKTGDRYTLLLAGGQKDPLSESSLKFYEAAAAYLGARYGNEPLLAGVHVTGASPQGHSEEQFWGRPMPAAAKAANKRMIDAWTKAFPDHVKLYAGSANDPAAMQELIRYGVAKTVGKFLYKNNAMSAKIPLDWQGNQLVVYAGKNGGQIGWEMVGSWQLERTRFGGSYGTMMSKVNELTKQAGKQRGQRYLAHYPPDINQLKSIQ